MEQINSSDIDSIIQVFSWLNAAHLIIYISQILKWVIIIAGWICFYLFVFKKFLKEHKAAF